MSNTKEKKDELLKLIKELRQDVTCIICLDLFNEPVTLHCDHTFCKTCYTTLLRHSTNSNVQCPLCKKETNRRDFTNNTHIEAVVTAVKTYTNILARSWSDDETQAEPPNPKRTEKKKEKVTKKKILKKIENEYVTLPIIKTTSLRKARSLDCIAIRDNTNTTNKCKRYSLDNVNNHNDKVSIDEYDSQRLVEKYTIFNMEEDYLANLENEMLANSSDIPNKNETTNKKRLEIDKKKKLKHESSFNWGNKSFQSDCSDAGWSRMKSTKKIVEKKGKKLKQLNISSFSTNDNKKENLGGSTKKNNLNKNSDSNKMKTRSVLSTIASKSPVKLPKNRPVYKLDQFETYLQENLTATIEQNENKLNTSMTTRGQKKKEMEMSNNEVNDKNLNTENFKNPTKTTVDIKSTTNTTVSPTKSTVNIKSSSNTTPNNKRLTRSCNKNKDETKNTSIKNKKEINLDQKIQSEIDKPNEKQNISEDDDIFDISTQKLNLPQKNIACSTTESECDDHIFDLRTQKLSSTELDRPFYENDLREEESNEFDAKKRKLNTNDDLDLIKVWSPVPILNSPKNDMSKDIISNTDEAEDIIVKAVVHDTSKHEKCKIDLIDKSEQEFMDPDVRLGNKINDKCLEHLSMIQNDVLTNNNIVKELCSFLSCSKSLFSSISQGKNLDDKVSEKDLINKSIKPIVDVSHVNSLPNLSNDKEVVDFYNTAIPYLNNLRKLYDDFKLVVNDITTNTKNLTEVFGQNSESINALLSSNERNNSNLSDTSLENILYENIDPKIDVEVQTDSEIKCPKCSHQFNLNISETDQNDMDLCSMNLTNDNFINISMKDDVLIQNISSMKKIEENLLKKSLDIDKKVNRQLKFCQTNEMEKRYKRIRTQSSDSDSDSGVQKKAKCSETKNEDADIFFLSDPSEKEVPLNKSQALKNDEEIELQKLLDNYKKSELVNRNDKKNVTQDMTAKYIDILEREYKELDVIKTKIPEPVVKNTPSPRTTSRDTQSITKLPNSILENLEKLDDFNHSFHATLPRKFESQFSKSLFTESDRKNNANTSFKQLEVTKNTEKFSMSMFTEHVDRNSSMQQSSSKSQNDVLNTSGKDIFEDELDAEVEGHLSNHIIEDSLDGDIFDNINVVESTPQKDKEIRRQTRSKVNLDDLVSGLNDQASDMVSDIDLQNTEWVHDLPPPPEFQDSDPIKTKPTNMSDVDPDKTIAILLSPDYVSLSIRPSNNQTLNKRIDLSERKNELYKSFNICDIDPADFSSSNLDISRKSSTSDMNISTSVRNNPIKETRKNLNPISLVQGDTKSPLTIIKTSQHVPRTILCSTPKQPSIFNYIKTPSKANDSILSSKSICLTPRAGSNQSFDRMDITPVKTRLSTSIVRTGKQICLACTRLNREESMTLLSLTNKYNLVFTKQFTDEVTHLVVLVDDRNRIKDHTMKYVSAVANGIWIVSFSWVKDCLEHGKLLSEEPYEVLDVSGMNGPKQSRIRGKSNPLLNNFIFYCAEPFLSVAKADLEKVLTNLGAELIKKEEELEIKRPGKICLILTEAKISQDFDQYQSWLNTLNIITVDIEWLSRTVGQYQVSSIRPFMLCIDEGIENLGYPPYLIAVVPDSLTGFTETYTMRG